MSSVAMTKTDQSGWDQLQWRRRLETFGKNDASIVARGPKGEVDGIWYDQYPPFFLSKGLTAIPSQLEELTDKGRETTLALGERLRHLYVNQLNFMPQVIGDADMIYLRASPLPRALESVQQSFWGMYPLSARTATFPPPTIITRTFRDETLMPNDGNCQRFAQLSQAFGERAAKRCASWGSKFSFHLDRELIGHFQGTTRPRWSTSIH